MGYINMSLELDMIFDMRLCLFLMVELHPKMCLVKLQRSQGKWLQYSESCGFFQGMEKACRATGLESQFSHQSTLW